MSKLFKIRLKKAIKSLSDPVNTKVKSARLSRHTQVNTYVVTLRTTVMRQAAATRDARRR